MSEFTIRVGGEYAHKYVNVISHVISVSDGRVICAQFMPNHLPRYYVELTVEKFAAIHEPTDLSPLGKCVDALKEVTQVYSNCVVCGVDVDAGHPHDPDCSVGQALAAVKKAQVTI